MFFKRNYLAMRCLCSPYFGDFTVFTSCKKMQDLTILLLTILCRFPKLLEGNNFSLILTGHLRSYKKYSTLGPEEEEEVAMLSSTLSSGELSSIPSSLSSARSRGPSSSEESDHVTKLY